MLDELGLLDAALEATVRAGAAILSVYATDDIGVEEKLDGSPLTRADRAAHLAITESLARTGLPVLSEEGDGLAAVNRQSWLRFWLVDPLDGTKEFIKRNGEFTVNVALIERETSGAPGRPTLGVVLAPALGRLYVGAGARGAYRLDLPELAVPPTFEALADVGVRLPQTASPRAFTVVGSRSHGSEATARFVESLRAEHPELTLRGIGSSLKLCLVAEGTADVYPRFAPTMEWDTAAADAVCRAAGRGVFRWDAERGQPLRELEYGKPELLNPWFLAR